MVYGRGGFDQTPSSDDSDRLVRDSFDLRDDEQLLVKLSYRFETVKTEISRQDRQEHQERNCNETPGESLPGPGMSDSGRPVRH